MYIRNTLLLALASICASLCGFANVSSAEVTIDYAVFYTPEARETAGGSNSIRTRITNAFDGANHIFADSGAQITHRVVHVEELPVNNTSHTLPEANSELARAFNFFSVLDTTAADSSLVIINFQSPGGYANIPNSPGQARRGGGINLGLPNLSGPTLAHEMGHTLGATHDYVDEANANSFIPPSYNHGNHFLSAQSGVCYRTIMSALTQCRVPGYEHLPAVRVNLFSNSVMTYEGAPTGDPVNADEVRMFHDFAPFVGSARGESQFPDLPPPDDDEGGPGDDDGSHDEPEEEADTLTLQLTKSGRRTIVSGTCMTSFGTPLIGDTITISLLKRRGRERTLRSVSCSPDGTYRARVSKKGRLRASNSRTGTRSQVRRAR